MGEKVPSVDQITFSFDLLYFKGYKACSVIRCIVNFKTVMIVTSLQNGNFIY